MSPALQGHGLGRHLYERFFEISRAHGRSRVRAITSASNTGSYRFHLRMGFEAEPGPGSFEGRPTHPDYDGPGLDRVLFSRAVTPKEHLGLPDADDVKQGVIAYKIAAHAAKGNATASFSQLGA